MNHPGACSRNFGSGIFLLAGLLGWAGLPASAANTGAKRPAATIEIGNVGQPVRVILHTGDTLRVMLPATPSTGYGWQVAGNKSAVLQASSSKMATARDAIPGAPGRQSLSFTAGAPGRDRLVLEYRRPWEKNAKPARSYAVDVTVEPAGAGDSGRPAVVPAGTRMAIYAGKLPCADCSGIRTTIAFYAAGPQRMTDRYYVQTMKYIGAPTGDVVSIDAGSWSLKKGTGGDPNATVYSLRSNDSDHAENYLLRGETLVPLGSDGKPVQSPFNMNLTKRP